MDAFWLNWTSPIMSSKYSREVCVWKRSVHKATLQIIKGVYLPTFLLKGNVNVHIRIQDSYIDLLARVQKNHNQSNNTDGWGWDWQAM